jgi:hypothetical protein
MANPKKSIQLLKELQSLGFTDDAYWRVHPFRDADPPRKDTMASHIRYCTYKVKTLPYGRTGERVQTRLQFVLDERRADLADDSRQLRTF